MSAPIILNIIKDIMMEARDFKKEFLNIVYVSSIIKI